MSPAVVRAGLVPCSIAWRTKLGQRGLASFSDGVPRLGIIDDYLGTSAPHFAHMAPSKVKITTFNDTIVPVNEFETARLVERLKPFAMLSCVRERTAFPASLLGRLPNLRLLLATGTQFEAFDLAAAEKYGVAVVAAPGLGRTDTAEPPRPNIKKGGAHPTTQHTWALILALARNVALDDAAIKTSGQLGSPSWQTGLATSLTGSTLGLVGLGRLGAAVARIGFLAWGMNVICWSENLTQDKADNMAVQAGLSPDAGPGGTKTFRVVGKAELFSNADVVSLHYVLSERSRGIVGARDLDLMRPTSLLINASRGPLIDEDALINTLEKGKIHGCAMDVFDVEPLPLNSLWRRTGYWGQKGRSKVLTTPHMGYVDSALMNTWYAETAENVERWLDGRELLHRLA